MFKHEEFIKSINNPSFKERLVLPVHYQSLEDNPFRALKNNNDNNNENKLYILSTDVENSSSSTSLICRNFYY